MNIPFLDVKSGYEELKPELDEVYHQVMDSGIYIAGEMVDKFENEFSSYCGSIGCASVGSGLDALYFILKSYNIGEGDEVIVPSHTFIATWLAVSACGATPVPVEPKIDTYNIECEAIAEKVTEKTRAIIVVHMYGLPVDMDEIKALSDSKGIKLIEDAAQAHGAIYKGRKTGTLGDAAAFSFYPGKNLGAFGDAGAVVSNDSDLIENIKRRRNYGQVARYDHQLIGGNSRMDPLQASFLSVKLRYLDEWNSRRRDISAHYTNELSEFDSIRLPMVFSGAEHAWHLYVIRTQNRNKLQEQLTAKGIVTQIHYPISVHKSGAYKEFSGINLPVADEIAATGLSLPIGPHLEVAQVEYIIDKIKESIINE